MIARIIAWSLERRLLVLLASVGLALWGLVSLRATAIDALPDLSDVQVIVRSSRTGQAPQFVEDQVTYPLRALVRIISSTPRVPLCGCSKARL